jgi:hypothetical protein
MTLNTEKHESQKKKTWSFVKSLNTGKDCSNKSFSLKEKKEEEGEKKGCTKNVPLCNESDLQTR